jgi:hypothetical protein
MRTALEAQRVRRSPRGARDIALIDLLDRLLAGGVVVHGEITLAAADIDLVDIALQLVVGTVSAVGRDLHGPLDRARN